MATNVYGNGLNSTAGANTITHFYDRAGIKAANRVNIYQQFADRKSMPTSMGKTFKISKFLHMYDRALADADFAAKGYMTARTASEVSTALTNATLTEGAGAVNKRSLQKITVDTSLARYGEMIDYTDEVELFSEDAIQTRYREELGALANSRFEDLVQLDMLGTATVMYSGAATSMATIGLGVAADGSTDHVYKASYDLIRKATRKLVRNRAKKNTQIVTGSTNIDTKTIAQAYYAVIGADVKADLEVAKNSVGELAWVPVHKYGAAASIAEGEVGAMHEVRFIEAESAIVYAKEGAVVPAGYTGSLKFTGNAANLVIYNTTSSAVDITGIVTTNPYGTSIAAGARVTAATEADAVLLAAVAGLERSPGNFDVFPILFPTQGAFATVGLKGNDKIKFHSKSPAEVENANPYGTNGFFSYNFWYAGILLESEKVLKVLVAASK